MTPKALSREEIQEHSADYHNIILKHKVTTYSQFNGEYDTMTGERRNSIWRECSCGQKFY